MGTEGKGDEGVDRRRLLAAAGVAAAAALAASGRRHAEARPEGEAQGAGGERRILILGGTGFLGPAVVEAARSRGHALTLFNRGRTNPGLFPDIEQLRGDRNGDLESLKGRKWDAVVDTSAYVPRVARLTASLLKDAVKHYVFVSTISVYPGFGTSYAPIDEETAVGRLEDPTTEKVTGETYGPLKALCEEAVEAEMPGRVAQVRPGLIVGPRDPTDRFTWWPVRVHRGGEIAAPGDGSTPVQVVDVRDLGAFIVRLIEDGTTGTFNATGFDGPLSFVEFLHGLKCELNTQARFTWIPEAVLEAEGVAPFSQMPLWIPRAGMPVVANARARAAGLRFRPVTATARDTVAWFETERKERGLSPRVGLPAEREQALIAAAQTAETTR